jgi:hypothetical protein
MSEEKKHFDSCIYIGYFYPDGIVKYDGFSMPQIDGTINKTDFYSPLQRYNAKISR